MRNRWAMFHDTVAHPLMGVTLYAGWAVRFHYLTSQRAWPRPRGDGAVKVSPRATYLENKVWAMFHDMVAHPLMGVTLYAGWTVRFHNFTSQRAWSQPRSPTS
jgi:uncharacterized membrane protein